MTLESDLEAVAEYLSTRNVTGDTPSMNRAIKLKAENYLLHDGSLYRHTKKSLNYVPRNEKRLLIMKGLHGEIGN